MNALLSIIGLYIDKPDIFDDFHIPDALDKDALVNLLLAELGELNTIYSDPDVMKFMINIWSKSRTDIWEHLQATKEYDYNPIWNKDGTYTETETRDLAGTNKGKVTSSGKRSGSDEQTTTEKVTGSGTNKEVTDSTVKDAGTETTTTQRSAFDSSNYQPVERVTTERNNTTDTDGTVTTTGSSETNTTETVKGKSSGTDEGLTNTDINTTDTGTITRTRRETGNIGVTTTQQMIREEREIADLDLYHLIINEFKNRFCIMVY